MRLGEFAAATGKTIAKPFQGLARYLPFERVLAGVLVLTPLALWLANWRKLENSISAFYDITNNHWFYVPLTMAVMLFVINGVIREKHVYNTLLGVMLLGVLMFNHDDFSWIHAIFATAFFVGNVLVIIFFSKTERWIKIGFVGAIAVAMGAYYLFDSFTLFWAESLSLAAIAGHYILDSFEGATFYAAA